MKMKRKVLSVIIALALASGFLLPAYALDENETPILSPFDSFKSSKLPVELSKIMAKASDDEMIGVSDEDPILVMYFALPTDMEQEEHALESYHLEPMLSRAGVDFRQVTQTGDVYYEAKNGVFSALDGISDIPQMPDGTDFIHYNGYEKYYEELDYPIVHRGVVSLCATAPQIKRLCEDEDVICFSYGTNTASIAYGTYYAHFTSDDALNILRAAVGIEEKYDAADITADGVVDSMDALLALRESLSLQTIYYLYRGGELDTHAYYN